MTTASDGSWVPGIGDPSVVGWVTVAAYFGTALLALRCVRLSYTSRITDRGKRRRLTGAWTSVALLFLLLGVNKQLDLQSFFTIVARRAVMARDLYERRHVYQEVFIAALVAAAGFGLLVLGRLLRRELGQLWLALLGSVLVVAFVLLRASSFHHVDFLLASTLGGWRLNWIFELSGISLVALGALGFERGRRRQR